jgi:hypothetical protein
LTGHIELEHVPPRQLWPHAPQFDPSLVRSAHTPLQQGALDDEHTAPTATACVPHTWLVHVATVHDAGAGQSAATSHATQLPFPSHTPPVQATPLAAFATPHVWPAHVATLHVAGAGQSLGASHATHEPLPSQTLPPPSEHAAPASAVLVPQACAEHTGVAHTVPVAGQSAAAAQATQCPAPSQTLPPPSEQVFPEAALAVPHTCAVQVGEAQVVPVAGQSAATLHPTQWPAPSQTLELPHAVPAASALVPHRLVAHVAAWHAGGAPQSAGATHAAHFPSPSQTLPPLSEQTVEAAAFVVPHVLLAHVLVLQTVVWTAQSLASKHATQLPLPSQTVPPLDVQFVPLVAFSTAQQPAVHALVTHAFVEVAQAFGVVHAVPPSHVFVAPPVPLLVLEELLVLDELLVLEELDAPPVPLVLVELLAELLLVVLELLAPPVPAVVACPDPQPNAAPAAPATTMSAKATSYRKRAALVIRIERPPRRASGHTGTLASGTTCCGSLSSVHRRNLLVGSASAGHRRGPRHSSDQNAISVPCRVAIRRTRQAPSARRPCRAICARCRSSYRGRRTSGSNLRI